MRHDVDNVDGARLAPELFLDEIGNVFLLDLSNINVLHQRHPLDDDSATREPASSTLCGIALRIQQ